MFKDCLHPDYQLISSNPLAAPHKYLAMGLMVRGNITFSDVNRNIKKLKEQCEMIHWNKEGFKYGICNVPPVGQVSALYFFEIFVYNPFFNKALFTPDFV